MLSHRSRATVPVFALASVLVISAFVPGLLAQDTGQEPTQDAAEGGAPAAEDPVVAVVNGTELRRSDVVASARDLPQAYQDQLDQIFPALVDRLIDLTLLLDEGKRRNLQDDGEVKERVALYQDQVIRDTVLDRQIKEKVTEEAIKARYDKTVQEFQPQPEIHARHILVGTEDEAKAIIAELDAGGDFQKIAKEKSTDSGSGANGGDLGFFTPDQMVPEFSQAAVALEPGSYTKVPVKSRFGWHIIKVEEKRDSSPPTLEQARPEIVNQLQQEAINDLVKDLRSHAKIEKVEAPAGAAPPAEAAPPEEAAPPAAGDAPPAGSSEETPPVE